MKEPRPFNSFIQDIRNGDLHSEITLALRDLVLAVETHGKAGTLTLTLKVSPELNSKMIYIIDDLKVKPPLVKTPPTIFYADNDFDLTRSDPRQMSLSDLKQPSDAPTEELKELSPGAVKLKEVFDQLAE